MRGVTSSSVVVLALILTTIGCGEMAAPIPAAEAPPYTYETEGTGSGSDDGSVSSRKTAEPSGPSGPSEPGLPAQDGGNGNDTDANPNPVPETCTAGTVRCSSSGFAQECLSGGTGTAWVTVTPAAPCTSVCTAPVGTFKVDRGQLSPAPSAIVRKGKDPVVFAQRLLGPVSFEQAKTMCSQFGPGWRMTFFEPSSISADVLGCNPMADHAAFPAMPSEVWAWNGDSSSPPYIFSFVDNNTHPIALNDNAQRRVMCVKDVP